MIHRIRRLLQTVRGTGTANAKRKSRARRLLVDGLETRELLTVVSVAGQANIYGAGLATPPAPGGGGGGVLPTAITLSTLGNPSILTFPTVIGRVSGWAGTGGYNGADGGPNWGGVTNVPSWRGISGIQNNKGTMFLVGVFLGPTGQPTTAPATPNVTNANALTSFSPVIGQQFYIGDGRTATQVLQTFNVPKGASKLYLGFAEVWGFGNSKLLPGYYNDNAGVLTVDVQAKSGSITRSSNVNPDLYVAPPADVIIPTIKPRLAARSTATPRVIHV